MWRAMFGGMLATMSLAGAGGRLTSPIVLGKASQEQPSCLDRLHLKLTLQGENTTTRIDVDGSVEGQRCSFRGTVVISLRRSSSELGVKGNPLRVVERGIAIGPTWTVLLRADWGNWCGARNDIVALTHVGPRVAKHAVSPVPLCLQPDQLSKLSRVN